MRPRGLLLLAEVSRPTEAVAGPASALIVDPQGRVLHSFPSRPAQPGCCSQARTSLRSRATASHPDPDRHGSCHRPLAAGGRVAGATAGLAAIVTPTLASDHATPRPLGFTLLRSTHIHAAVSATASRTATQSHAARAGAGLYSYRSGRFGIGCADRFVVVSLSLHVIRLIARERKSPMAPRRCSSMQRRLGSRCWRCEPDPRARGRLNTAVRGVRFHHTQ